ASGSDRPTRRIRWEIRFLPGATRSPFAATERTRRATAKRSVGSSRRATSSSSCPDRARSRSPRHECASALEVESRGCDMRAHRLLFVLLGFLAALPRGVLSGVETVWPDSEWPDARPEEVGLDAALLEKARDYALTGDGSGIITRHGRVVLH